MVHVREELRCIYVNWDAHERLAYFKFATFFAFFQLFYTKNAERLF